ncbi:hypothetical protein ATY77_29500 [Rhizobium sp. R634]|nr:hypothetical protein ATY77_29500 [Rhizobium sp. R634]
MMLSDIVGYILLFGTAVGVVVFCLRAIWTGHLPMKSYFGSPPDLYRSERPIQFWFVTGMYLFGTFAACVVLLRHIFGI